MMSKLKYGLLMLLLTLFFSDMHAQKNPWKKGILVDEFIYDTAPFPSCHAATIAETPEGLVAAWFGGTREGHPDVEIWTSRLVNDHWTKPVSVANGIVNDTLRYPCYNPVLYQAPHGKLFLFYKIGPRPAKWKGWVKTSTDNGRTWSEAEALPEGFIGPVKDKPVMLSNGILLSPSSTENDGWKVHFEASADTGKTWTMIGPINDGKTVSAIQPAILIHKNGDLQALARSKVRAILDTWSHDNGKTWTPLTPMALPNNNSGLDAVTLKDGRFLLVYNHVLPPADAKNGKGARTPLNLAWSKDGKTWYAAAILEDSPISQYSYPSIIQGYDGMVHIVYTWRRQKIKYVKVDPSKLIGKKIIDGKWPEMKGYRVPQPGEAGDD
jgi:alpha-L-rhamnosidase